MYCCKEKLQRKEERGIYKTHTYSLDHILTLVLYKVFCDCYCFVLFHCYRLNPEPCIGQIFKNYVVFMKDLPWLMISVERILSLTKSSLTPQFDGMPHGQRRRENVISFNKEVSFYSQCY